MTGSLFHRRRLWLCSASLTVLLAPGVLAGPLTVSDTQTTAVSTSVGDGQGPGSITIDTNGAVDVDAGIPVTLDSSHDILNDGLVRTDDESNAVGVLIDTSSGPLTANYSGAGQITILGPTAGTDLADSEVANIGIRATGGNLLDGSITLANGAGINVSGIGSFGVLSGTSISGSFNNGGVIDVRGDQSTAAMFQADVGGDIINTGSLLAPDDGGDGLILLGSVGGQVRMEGVVTAGNVNFTTTTDTGDRGLGSVGIWAANSVANGIYIQGNSTTAVVEQDLESDDPVFDLTDANITTNGVSQALRIGHSLDAPTAQNIVIGAAGVGEEAYALVNRGILNSQASQAEGGVDLTTISIAGTEIGGTVYTTTLAGGFNNIGGDVRATVVDGSGTILEIGDHGVVPELRNSGDMFAFITDTGDDPDNGVFGELAGAATVVRVSENGYLGSVTNTGGLQAGTDSADNDARIIWDLSGTLESVTNSGSMIAIRPDGATGRQIAIDVSARTGAFSLVNTGEIQGDLLLAQGNNSLTFTGAQQDGIISLGAGNDALSATDSTLLGSIDFGGGVNQASIVNSEVTGVITAASGSLDATMANSTWSIGADTVSSFSSIIINNSTLLVDVDGVADRSGLINSSGLAFIGPGTTITPVFRTFITEEKVFDLVQANNLQVNIELGAATAVSTSYMHESSVGFSPTDPNVLQLTVRRRSSEDLGLNRVSTALYDSATQALAADGEFFTALASQTTQEGFEGALNQLLPDTSNGWVQNALNTQNLMLSNVSRRLDRVQASRSYGLARSNFWWQNMGHFASRDGNDELAGYDAWSFGFSLGFDNQLTDSVRAGLGFTQTWSAVDENNSFDRAQRINSSQLSAYLRAGSRLRHVQAIATYSFDDYNTQRNIEFDEFDRQSTADWKGTQLGASVQAAWGQTFRFVELVPAIGVSYLDISQDGYEETGGGAAIDLAFEDKSADSIRGFANVTAQTLLYRAEGNTFSAWGRAGFNREFSNEALTYQARFLSSTESFTIVGDDLVQNLFTFGTGLSYVGDFFTFAADYDSEWASNYRSHFGSLSIKFRF